MWPWHRQPGSGRRGQPPGRGALYDRFYADPQSDRHAALGMAIAAANAAIKAAGEADLNKAGMGSTLVALVCHNNQASWVMPATAGPIACAGASWNG